ncbi:MAG: hypothetical protein ABEH35_00810 [Haloarculaceae archaeon]
MTDLSRSLSSDRRPLFLYIGSGVFLIGLVAFSVGAVSVAYELLAGVTAAAETTLWATTAAGIAVPLVLAGSVVALSERNVYRQTATGLTLASTGIVLLWLLVPNGWTGAPQLRLIPAAVSYAAGTAVLTVSLFTAVIGAESTARSTPAVASVNRTTESARRASVTDGGDEDEELDFLLDDDKE